MNAYDSTIVLLIILLVVLNGKSILAYFNWLNFKIKTIYKQTKNARSNKTYRRSREI